MVRPPTDEGVDNFDFRQALIYIKPYRRRLIPILVASLLGTALSLYLPYLSKNLIDGALLGRNLSALLNIVALFFALTGLSFALNVWSGLRYTRISAEILFDMRLALYRHLQRLSPRFFARTRLGDIVSRLNNDIGEVQRVAAETVLALVGNLLFLGGTIVMMLWLDVALFLLSIALLPVSLWVLVHFRRRLGVRVSELRQRSADIGSFLIETLQGMKLVVSSNAQSREVDHFSRRNASFIRTLMDMQLQTYLAGGLPSLILSVSSALVFLYGGYQVINQQMTLGTFVAFIAYQMRLMGPVQALMGLYTNLATARVSLGRIQQLFRTRPEVVEVPDAIPLPRAVGEVCFEEVSFCYGRGGPILEKVSFRARPGETLAVVGASGSGKSTIADLMLRMMDPDAGQIRLDGHDLRDLRLKDLRRQVAAVDQEPFLFNATVAENLRYAQPDATDEQVAEAAERAGLNEFVQSLPQHYETEVGERGMQLSSGERQRIAIARAFLADPAVLVLDEATSFLDPGTEAKVLSGYEAIMCGRTTILITHRLQLANQAHRVVVLSGANLVEEGSPQELRERRGAFAELFALTP